jgi:hypothetical protein
VRAPRPLSVVIRPSRSRSSLPGRARVAAAAACLLAVGCGGGGKGDGTPATTPAAATSDSPVKDTWMFQVVATPALLSPFEKQGAVGNAWLDLYHNDLGTAVAAFGKVCQPSTKSYADRAADGFPCIGKARAELEKGRTLLMASDLDRVARRQFYAHRRDRPEEVLASVHQPYFEGLLLLRSGEVDAGDAMLRAYATTDGADPLLAALAPRIADGYGSDPLISRIWGDSKVDAPADATLGELPTSEASAGYAARLVVMEAIAKGDIDTALANLRPVRSTVADLLETLEQTTESGTKLEVSLFHFDSTYLRTLARWNGLDAVRAIDGAPDLALLSAEASQLLGRDVALPASAPSIADGLAFVVFSDWLSPADRLEDLRPGNRPASLRRFGVAEPGLLLSPREKLSDLDELVRLSNVLKGQLTEQIRAAGPEGGNMDEGMGLSKRFLGRLLLDEATDLQQALDVRLDAKPGADMETGGVSARSLLESALDKNPSPPSQLLRDARISFRNDPTLLMELARANLDTKRPYYANDYIRPLTVVYPELIPVREGLAALDSAWNPARAGAVR